MERALHASKKTSAELRFKWPFGIAEVPTSSQVYFCYSYYIKKGLRGAVFQALFWYRRSTCQCPDISALLVLKRRSPARNRLSNALLVWCECLLMSGYTRGTPAVSNSDLNSKLYKISTRVINNLTTAQENISSFTKTREAAVKE